MNMNMITCGGPHIYGGGGCPDATAELKYGAKATLGP